MKEKLLTKTAGIRILIGGAIFFAVGAFFSGAYVTSSLIGNTLAVIGILILLAGLIIVSWALVRENMNKV